LLPPDDSSSQADDPDALLDELKTRYWKAVQELYDQHKDKYGYKDIPLKLL
jgi:hypothetical protein